MSEPAESREPHVTPGSPAGDQPSRSTPAGRGGALPPADAGDAADPVEEASEESFPASDPPTYPRVT